MKTFYMLLNLVNSILFTIDGVLALKLQEYGMSVACVFLAAFFLEAAVERRFIRLPFDNLS